MFDFDFGDLFAHLDRDVPFVEQLENSVADVCDSMHHLADLLDDQNKGKAVVK